MSPMPALVEFVGFGAAAVIALEVSYKNEAIDVTSGGYPWSTNSPFKEYVPGPTYVYVEVKGDFGHREIGGSLMGNPGTFHKLHTSLDRDRGECTTLFQFVQTDLPKMEKR